LQQPEIQSSTSAAVKYGLPLRSANTFWAKKPWFLRSTSSGSTRKAIHFAQVQHCRNVSCLFSPYNDLPSLPLFGGRIALFVGLKAPWPDRLGSVADWRIASSLDAVMILFR
jgi:hypothetical protein